MLARSENFLFWGVFGEIGVRISGGWRKQAESPMKSERVTKSGQK